MKKSKLMLLTISALTASLFLFSCKNPAEPEKKNENSSDTVKSTDLIKFKYNNASVLATTWVNSNSSRSARAADDDPLESLVAISEDGTTENVMEVPTEELELADWCQPLPVREVYKCPYDNVDAGAKGVYTVFDGHIDWWKYKDESDAPHVGQILYVKPDGTTFDILNFDNDVARTAKTWIKEWSGHDYIKFDDDGRIYILVSEDDGSGECVYCYDPTNDSREKYALNISGLVIQHYAISSDGKWIFIAGTTEDDEWNLYAIKAKSNAEPICIYEYSAEKQDGWSNNIDSISVNPINNKVYWYVCESDSTRPHSGLYIASRDITGNYSKEAVRRYACPTWFFNEAKKKYIKFWDWDNWEYKDGVSAEENDYAGFLEYMKAYCQGLGEVEFSLKWFKDKTEYTIHHEDGTSDVGDLSILYKEDKNGNALTDVEALKYLFETTQKDAFSISDEETTKENLYPLWCTSLSWGIEEDYNHNPDFNPEYGEKGWGFPLEVFFYKKGTDELAFDDALRNVNRGNLIGEGGSVLANNNGMWCFAGQWSEEENRLAHSIIYNLTDSDGNLTCYQPGNLSEFKFYSDDGVEREESDPWRKLPFATNYKGFASISENQKTIYYYDGNEVVDLLEKDDRKNSIGAIYSFSLDNSKLIYNAVKANGGYMMGSVDLATKEVTKIPVTIKVENMLSVK